MSDVRPEAVARLLALPEGWDSYGALRISPEVLTVIESLHVTPCVDGGVQIEINGAGWETELRFAPDGRPMAFITEESTK